MDYIDASTNSLLKEGIIEFLNIKDEDIKSLFDSILNYHKDNPNKVIEDYIEHLKIKVPLNKIQMYHLSRRLNGSDLSLNYNLEKLLLENTPVSDFLKKFNITFLKGNSNIEIYYKEELQVLDNKNKFNDRIVSYMKSRLGYYEIKDYCINGFAYRENLEDENTYFHKLSKCPEIVSSIGELLNIKGMVSEYEKNSKYYVIKYLVPFSEIIINDKPYMKNNLEKTKLFLRLSLLRLYDDYINTSITTNIMLRLDDYAIMDKKYFVDAEYIYSR